jgi:hypothetical protein
MFYFMGNVSDNSSVGGLLGINVGTGVMTRSFWDKETSGMEVSDGGMATIATEMQDIAMFSGVGWNVIALANPGAGNLSYTWTIVDGEAYPFSSWPP